MKALRPLILFCIGGLIYVTIEIAWRGYSAASMLLVGGLCFVLIGEINERIKILPLFIQMAIGAILVTVIELIAGIILNIYLGLVVWDYSDMPYNIAGQICLYYSLAWFFLSLPAIVVDDIIRYVLFGEKMPHYKFWF